MAESGVHRLEAKQPFAEILSMMSVDSYDPAVPVAMKEYASRFAAELLRDARDYSTHAGRSEINGDDIKLAVKLNDSYAVSLDARESVAHRAREAMQSKNLTELADPRSTQLRYPPGQFIQRAYTYVPGSEAYPEESDEEEGDDSADRMDVAEETGRMERMVGGRARGVDATKYDSAVGVKFQPGSRTGPHKLVPTAGFATDES